MAKFRSIQDFRRQLHFRKNEVILLLSQSETELISLNIFKSISIIQDCVFRTQYSIDENDKKITLAALINSSAKHSAIDLMLRNAASRAPVQSNQIA